MQNGTRIVCVINVDVETCQVRCNWGIKASYSKTQGMSHVIAI